MKQKTLTRLSLATALGLLTPLPGYAFGLGQITVQSAMNEPFRAEIPVNAIRDDERGNLEVMLASNQDFERAGLDRNFLVSQLNFEVIEEGDSTRILVTSEVPIKEPFLGFLMAATTGQGKLLREYTVLLDPPKELYRGREQADPTSSAVTQQTAPTQSTSDLRPRNLVSSRSSNAAEYKVRSAQTLWSIAENVRPSADISMPQMMIALLNANPQAFQQNNVNGLYADSTLRVPTTEEIKRLTAAEAKAAIDLQNLAWKNRNLGQTSPQALSANEILPLDDIVSDIDNPTELANAAENETGSIEENEQISDAENARLKLVAANENNVLDADPEVNGDVDLEKISEQLTLAQETIEAQTQENIDFKNRMDTMERQLDTMRRLISLKDADMARLQSLLEQDETQMDLSTLVDEANAILESSEAENEAASITEQATNQENTNPVVTDDIATIDDETAIETDSTENPTELLNAETVADSTDLAETTIITDENVNNTNLNEVDEASEWQPVDIENNDAVLNSEIDNAVSISDSNIEDVTEDPEIADDGSSLEQTTSIEPSTDEIETVASEVDAAINEAAQMLNLDQDQIDSLYDRVHAFVLAHKVESLLAILLLLLIIWMIIRRGHREVSWDDAVSKINKNKPVKKTADTDVVNVAPPLPITAEKTPVTETKTKSVDELVEQADMFVGYADYVQAGTALEQAHQQAPLDKEIATKLMFVYFKQHKSSDFIAVMNTAKIDENYSQWSDIRRWGAALLPHNPLFDDTSENGTEETAPVVSKAEERESTYPVDEETSSVETIDAIAEDETPDHIDFNLDDYQTESSKPSPANDIYERDEEDLLQFDTNYVPAEKSPLVDLDEPVSENTSDDNDLRIDMENDNVLQPDTSALDILDLSIDDDANDELSDNSVTDEPVETLSLDSLDTDELDLSDFETEDETSTETNDVIEDYLNLDSQTEDEELDFDLSDFDSIDEAETKLDLAAAYSDMGDPEGARGILEEVLEQGTDEQKQRAQELLDTLL